MLLHLIQMHQLQPDAEEDRPAGFGTSSSAWWPNPAASEFYPALAHEEVGEHDEDDPGEESEEEEDPDRVANVLREIMEQPGRRGGVAVISDRACASFAAS